MQSRAVFFTADALSKLLHWKRESTVSTFLCCSWFRRLLSFPSITNFSWLESHSLIDPSCVGAFSPVAGPLALPRPHEDEGTPACSDQDASDTQTVCCCTVVLMLFSGLFFNNF